MADAKNLSHAEENIWQMAALLAKLYPAEARESVSLLIDDIIESGDTDRAELWARILTSMDELLKAPSDRMCF